MNIKLILAELYREYRNNFLTAERFAEYIETSTLDAETLIQLGEKFHNEAAEEYRSQQEYKRGVK